MRYILYIILISLGLLVSTTSKADLPRLTFNFEQDVQLLQNCSKLNSIIASKDKIRVSPRALIYYKKLHSYLEPWYWRHCV